MQRSLRFVLRKLRFLSGNAEALQLFSGFEVRRSPEISKQGPQRLIELGRLIRCKALGTSHESRSAIQYLASIKQRVRCKPLEPVTQP